MPPPLINSYMLCGAITFPSLFILSHMVLRRIPSYSDGDIFTIATRFVSAIQAIQACIAGVWIMAYTYEDIMYARHWLANAYLGFIMPYFYYDTCAMYLTHFYVSQRHIWGAETMYTAKSIGRFIRADKLMMVHHIVLPAIVYPILVLLRNDVGDFFIGSFLLVELPIPCISLRAVMLQLKVDQNCRAYVINGVVLIMSFIISRVLIFPFLFWRFSLYKNIQIYSVPLHIPYKCTVISTIFFTMNIIWSYRMGNIAMRTFKKYKEAEKAVQQQRNS